MQTPPGRLDAPPETLDGDPPLHAVMSTHLVAITPDTPVTTALHVMATRDVRHLPVVDGSRCTGMVTEPDLLRGIAAERGPLGRATLRVHDVAGRALVLPRQTRLSEATASMADEGLDAVLVGAPAALVGIVTSTDMIRIWSRYARTAAPPQHTFPGSGPVPASHNPT